MPCAARQRRCHTGTAVVGCNLCALVCPVEGCITMEEVAAGGPAHTWKQWEAEHPEHQHHPHSTG